MRGILLIGRILFSLIFILAITSHFKAQTFQYATSKGVPYANILVPVSGIIAIAGGISIALGLRARVGAWLLVIFLVPVTLFMHGFWRETEPMMQQIQMGMFLKNLSMLGGAFIIAYFGAGPLSFDNRRMLPAIRHEEEVQRLITENKGMRVEDTRENIKTDVFSAERSSDLHLKHFWQNADDPNEVNFLFKTRNLKEARKILKRRKKETGVTLGRYLFPAIS